MGTVNGLAEFTDGQFKRRMLEGALAAALRQSGSRLWVATIDEGVLAVDLKENSRGLSRLR